MADQINAQAAAQGVADAIRFIGRVPHDEVSAYYGLVDLLVYPRHSQRLTELVTPLKPLEAMARGRLVLASDVGGHRELIRDGETGFLFRADDVAALAKAALDILASPAQWPRIRDEARRFVVEERTWATSVARYRESYRSALSLRREAKAA
jgi:glycosyltransferase involved in cell wall biosynthesis